MNIGGSLSNEAIRLYISSCKKLMAFLKTFLVVDI
jgi:hypothetical protein